MVFITTVLSLAAVAHGVLATPLRSRSPYAVKETHNVPEEWTKRGSAPEDHSLHLHIGLRQGQFDELERHLVEVSDPDHHRYGQHLSAEDVNELVKPSNEALELVHEWLADNDVDIAGLRYSPARDWIDIRMPVSAIERLLDTKYSVYEHHDGSQLVRTHQWSLPRHLHEHIDAIQPTTLFMRTGGKAEPARIGARQIGPPGRSPSPSSTRLTPNPRPLGATFSSSTASSSSSSPTSRQAGPSVGASRPSTGSASTQPGPGSVSPRPGPGPASSQSGPGFSTFRGPGTRPPDSSSSSSQPSPGFSTFRGPGTRPSESRSSSSEPSPDFTTRRGPGTRPPASSSVSPQPGPDPLSTRRGPGSAPSGSGSAPTRPSPTSSSPLFRPNIDAVRASSSTSPQRPSSSPQRPSSSVQRPTSGPNRPTNGPERPTSGPERPTSGGQRPTSGPQRPTSGPERPGTTRQSSSSTTRQGPTRTPQQPNNDNDAQRARLRQEGISRSCNASLVTPECLQYLYNADNYTAISGKSRIGFVNYLGNVPIRPDARQFLAKYRPDAVADADNFTQTSVNGGPVQDGPLNATQLERHDSIGANQDIQAIAGMAGPIGIDSWSVGGSPSDFQPDEGTPINTNEPYVEWLNYVLRRDTLPQVIASGYYDNEQTVPESYARRVCTMFAQLGARGVTVLVPSGDFGVGINETCISNDGRSKRKFIPVFPATCPWVTAVGATHQFSPEAAAYRAPNPSVNDTAGFASGGGSSDYFRRPTYQNNAVNMYVNGLGRAHEGMYNKTGRGYPDVATHGANHVFVWNGTEHPISGTGQAAALHAGILGLVNDARLNGTNGTSPRPALGFLNPWLYSRGWRVYTDVTRGRAVGCGTDGFPATEGWDAVTGFGTPDFRKLMGQ
ncbi:Peptidase S8/S53 subtilisin/kexin/sedolisin [Lasiodiplodia theobromae]|uniref:tripeptidyl-peptidase II n=1 Tax=Lasiodiplodia theobromae TaxID=45133 RepID=A0A8H7IQH9_9PEZI|nr:Peptidase S8/S53 subtilisin/kexin/sedolisin [Lasiodiplodia theobromae]